MPEMINEKSPEVDMPSLVKVQMAGAPVVHRPDDQSQMFASNASLNQVGMLDNITYRLNFNEGLSVSQMDECVTYDMQRTARRAD
jgi:hypothetical protein